ncbi:hypothetical protein [Amycolatopsis anabasis]|uniref:hypothetical protein n=1 Tax=Amycolatopsis anabasis TaxID=1840409 RepID=UPI00131D022C|nr:hypothetical protein [Amycolatopsis anabasis]
MTAGDRRLRRLAKQTIHDLVQADPNPRERCVSGNRSLDGFLDAMLAGLELRRGRPIELVESPHLARRTCGAVVRYPDVDFVCVAAGLTPVHRAHCFLHEFGHLAYFHDMPGVPRDTAATRTVTAKGQVGNELLLDCAALEMLLPGRDPALAQGYLGRNVYGTSEERAVEILASVAMTGVGACRATLTESFEVDPADTLQALFVPRSQSCTLRP